MADPEKAPLAAADRAIIAYALRLTRNPKGMRREDVEGLRAAGLSDAEIFEVALLTAYYNYTNRVAEGLGVEPEPACSRSPSPAPATLGDVPRVSELLVGTSSRQTVTPGRGPASPAGPWS